MRIVIASPGSSRVLCEQLAARGHQVAAIQPARIDLGDFGGLSGMHRGEAAVCPVSWGRVFPLRPYPYSLYLTGARGLLRRMRPEIVYYVGEPSELSVAQLVRLTRRWSPDSRNVICSYETVDRWFRGFPRALRRMAFRTTLPRVDFITAGSLIARELLVTQGFPAERMRVVYLGVDGEHFSRSPDAAMRAELGGPERFVIGYVGRLAHPKGVDTLLGALRRLPERFVLAVAGAGDQDEQLRELAGRWGLQGRVRWLGRVPHERMPQLLSSLDVLVLPSRSTPVWTEQYGRVLPEAMLCGTPVIGSSSGAIPEVIGDAGLIFPEDDEAALADAIGRLRSDPELARSLAQAGLERARCLFAVEAQIAGLEAAFAAARALPRR